MINNIRPGRTIEMEEIIFFNSSND